VVERTQDLVLDHIGVALLGTTMPWSIQVRDVEIAQGARPQSTIYASRRTSARGAALVNGAAAHAIEFDDTHDESLQHPGCVAIPAALALSEAADRDGSIFLAAMIAGYEAQCRVGLALGAQLMQRGFHATATCGVFGAAAAAGRVLGSSAETVASAFGLAASMSGGLLQFSQDPKGSTIKRLYSGLPSERGLFAAQLAEEGFAGPSRALEGKFGFADVLTGGGSLEAVTHRLGEQLQVERITVKLYPCCKQFHSLIEAIEDCRSRRPFTANDVADIEPLGTRAMIDTHMEYRPQSVMAAQYSLPYTAAVAIAADAGDSASFDAPAIYRRDILELADRVKPQWNEDLEKHFPSKYPGGVRITLRDGTVLSSTVLDAKSSPERPIGRADVERKFATVTGSLLSPRRRQEIIDAVFALDRCKSMRAFARLLRNTRSETAAPVRRTSQPNASRRTRAVATS
jgi:2-methylcitrate dehydratase PrpD